MKTISCKKANKLLSLYSQNLLPPDWSERVKEHLCACPECQKAYQKTQGILNLLGNDRLPEPGEEFWKGMNSRVMSQVRQIRPEPVKISWTKKIWGNPFGWPGYAWATALILIFLTPVIFYTIQFKNQGQPPIREWIANDLRWEMGIEAFSPALETLSPKESIRLEKRLMAQLGWDFPRQAPLLAEDELQPDVSRSLEGLDKEELDLLLKKMQTGGSVGLKEEGYYVS